MGISITARPRRPAAVQMASFKVHEETDERLVLHGRRIGAFVAAAFLGVFGAVFGGAAWHFHSPGRAEPEVLIVGVFGVVLLALALLMFYFGTRRADRIVVDRAAGEIRFERRRKPLRLAVDDVAAVEVATQDRSRGSQRLIVHPVRLVSRGGDEVEVDAASDIEEMIRLAARLRRVLGKPLTKTPA